MVFLTKNLHAYVQKPLHKVCRVGGGVGGGGYKYLSLDIAT